MRRLIAILTTLMLYLPCRGVTTTTFIPATGGTFSRAAAAYYPSTSGLATYGSGVRRTISGYAVTNEPDPTWAGDEVTIASVGYRVVPQCVGKTYAYGTVVVSSVFDRFARRALTAGAAWEVVGGALRTDFQMYWFDDGSTHGILLRPASDGGGTAYLTVWWSNDAGTTWTRSLAAGTANPFVTVNTYDTATVDTNVFWWGWGRNPTTGTIMFAEYGEAAGVAGTVRYVWKSTDNGVSFGASLTTARKHKHLHALAYHAGTSTWIVDAGDVQEHQGVYTSADDGVTWLQQDGTVLAAPAYTATAVTLVQDGSNSTLTIDALIPSVSMAGLGGYIVQFNDTGSQYRITVGTGALTCTLAPNTLTSSRADAVENDLDTLAIFRGSPLGQVTGFLDYGDPTKILVASDWESFVQTYDLVTRAVARSYRHSPVNQRAQQGASWEVFQHGGLFYVLDYAGAGSRTVGSSFASLIVSPNRVDWYPYSRVTVDGSALSLGLRKFGGYYDGKLHLHAVAASGSYLHHYSVTPARLAARTGLLVCPATTNICSEVQSLFTAPANTNYWYSGYQTLSLSSAEVFRTGVQVVKAVDTAAGKYLSNTAIGSPTLTPVNTRVYQGSMYAKHSNASQTSTAVNLDAAGSSSAAYDSIDPSGWYDYRSLLKTAGATDTTVRMIASLTRSGAGGAAAAMTTYFGGVTIYENEPWVPFVPGGTPSLDEVWTNSFTPGSYWTHLTTISTLNGIDHLNSVYGSLYIVSYKLDSDDYIEVYYDCADNKIKVVSTDDGSASGTVPATSALALPDNAEILLATRYANGQIQISVRALGATQHVATVIKRTTDDFSGNAVTITTGKNDGTASLPMVVWDSKWIDAALNDTDLDAVMGAGRRGTWQDWRTNRIEW